MRFSIPEALTWLKTQGYEMAEPTYKKHWTEIQKIKDTKLLAIASRGLFEQHMERIENLELVLKLSWRNYHKLQAKDVYKAQKILDSIVLQQPILSQYYEATKFIIKEEYPELLKVFEATHENDPERIMKQFQKIDLEKRKKMKNEC